MTDKNTLVLQSSADAPRVEHGLCSDISVQSSDDGNEVINIKIEGEEICVKEEDELIVMSFSSRNDESEVSQQTFHQYLDFTSVIVVFCLSAFPHKSTPYGERKCSIYIYRV